MKIWLYRETSITTKVISAPVPSVVEFCSKEHLAREHGPGLKAMKPSFQQMLSKQSLQVLTFIAQWVRNTCVPCLWIPNRLFFFFFPCSWKCVLFGKCKLMWEFFQVSVRSLLLVGTGMFRTFICLLFWCHTIWNSQITSRLVDGMDSLKSEDSQLPSVLHLYMAFLLPVCTVAFRQAWRCHSKFSNTFISII